MPVGDILKSTLGVLSGGSTEQTPTIDPATGNAGVQSTPRSTGDMLRSMFSGMLTGLSGGVEANANGQHGALGAFSGGFKAQQAQVQQQKQQKQQQVQQTFENQQKTQKQQAELAYMRQQQATSMAEQHHLETESANLSQAADTEKWNHAQQVIEASQKADARASILAGFPDADGTSGFKTRGDAEQYAYTHPELTKQADLQIITDPDTGLTHIKKLPQTGPTTHQFTLPDGSKFEGAMTASEAAHFQLDLSKQTIDKENSERENRVAGATIAHLAAETKETNERVRQVVEDHKSDGVWKPGQREKLTNDTIKNLSSIATKLSQAKLREEDKIDPDGYQDLKDQYDNGKKLLETLRQPKPDIVQGTVQPPKGVDTSASHISIASNTLTQLQKLGRTPDQLKAIIDGAPEYTEKEKKYLKDKFAPLPPVSINEPQRNSQMEKFGNK